MEPYLLADILATQHAEGGFPSLVEQPEGSKQDYNCFITALTVLELLEVRKYFPEHKALQDAIERACSFLEHCEAPDLPGAFWYYPSNINTPRLNIAISPDLDDSAVAWLALLMAGTRGERAALSAIESVFEANRQSYRPPRAGKWVRPGAFRTWIGLPTHRNPVDCCVNANIIALYAYLHRNDRESYRAAVTTVSKGVSITKASYLYQRSLTPYYAHAMELLYAVRRAVRQGAYELQAALVVLEAQDWNHETSAAPYPRDRPICCNDWGKPIWTAPVLQAARELSATCRTIKLQNQVHSLPQH